MQLMSELDSLPDVKSSPLSAPVSYTHLDIEVAFVVEGSIVDGYIILITAKVVAGISDAAVSYTHLDVYKRQGLYLFDRKSNKISDFPHAEALKGKQVCSIIKDQKEMCIRDSFHTIPKTEDGKYGEWQTRQDKI